MTASGRSDGSVIIDTRMNTGGFTSGMANIKKGFSGISSSIGKIAKVIAGAFAVGQLTKFGKEAIQLGSDLAEVQNVVDVTFGSISGEIDEFAQDAIEKFGLSETAAKQYASTMGSMLKSMGFTTRDAADMSKALTGLAGDMASFYNLDADEAFAKLRSGISGETEPLKQLGINLSAANLEQYALAQGITKSYNAMTEQEKALLRYNYILSVTSDAQGDFARTSDSWANQTRILTERFKSLKATIGQGLINLFTPVIKVINTLLGKLTTVANAFKAFTELITGKKSSGTTSAPAASSGVSDNAMSDMSDGYASAAEGAENYADATEDAADATVKANKANKTYLSGLDEIRRYSEDITEVLPDQSANKGGGLDELPGTGSEAADTGVDFGSLAEGETVVDELNDKFDKLKDILAGIFKPFKDAWNSQGRSVMDSAKGMIDSLKKTIADIGKTWYDVWTSGVGQEYIESVLNKFRSIFDMIKAISDAFRAAWNDDGNGYNLIASFYTMLTNINNMLSAIRDSFTLAFSDGTGQAILSNVLQIITGIFQTVANLAGQFTSAWNAAGLGNSIMSNLLGFFNIILSTINSMVTATANWAATLDFTPLLTSINNLLVAIQPLAQNIGAGLAWFYQNVLLPLASFTIEEIIPRFFETLAQVLNVLNAILEALQPLFGWFWDNVLLPIAQWTGGIFLEIWDSINAALGQFAQWCRENPEVIQQVAIVVGAFFAAFELASLVTSAIGVIRGLITAISGVGGLHGVLSGLMSVLNGPLVIAIGAAIAAGVLLYQNWDDVKAVASQLWNDVLVPFGDWLKGIFVSIWTNTLKPALEFFINTILPDIVKAFRTLWEDYLVPFAEFLGGVFTSAWNEIVKPALEYMTNTVLPALISIFEDLWNDVLVPLGEFLSTVFKPIFDTLIKVLEYLWKNVVVPLAKVIGETFKAAFETAFTLIKNVVIPIVNTVIETLKKLWEQVMIPLGKFVGETFGPIFEAAGKIFRDVVCPAVENLISGLKNLWNNFLTPIGSFVRDTFGPIFDEVFGTINGLITSFQEGLDSVMRWIKNTFMYDWANVWASIKTIFSRAFEGLSDIARTPVNLVISAFNSIIGVINELIAKINSISFDITLPDWIPMVGGWGWSFPGFEIPYIGTIPLLAKGAVIPPNAPFAAILGDQPHGTNIEAPLSTIQKAVGDTLSKYNNVSSQNMTIRIPVILDGRQIFEAVIDEAKMKQLVSGRNPFEMA